MCTICFFECALKKVFLANYLCLIVRLITSRWIQLFWEGCLNRRWVVWFGFSCSTHCWWWLWCWQYRLHIVLFPLHFYSKLEHINGQTTHHVYLVIDVCSEILLWARWLWSVISCVHVGIFRVHVQLLLDWLCIAGPQYAKSFQALRNFLRVFIERWNFKASHAVDRAICLRRRVLVWNWVAI